MEDLDFHFCLGHCTSLHQRDLEREKSEIKIYELFVITNVGENNLVWCLGEGKKWFTGYLWVCVLCPYCKTKLLKH